MEIKILASKWAADTARYATLGLEVSTVIESKKVDCVYLKLVHLGEEGYTKSFWVV